MLGKAGKGKRFFMITTLHIKNVGIIEDLTVDFNEGLNILTGETGAGKTLISLQEEDFQKK